MLLIFSLYFFERALSNLKFASPLVLWRRIGGKLSALPMDVESDILVSDETLVEHFVVVLGCVAQRATSRTNSNHHRCL